ncbi:alpha/beta hydrolase [Pseudomonas alliivorans]|nr:alpha/beta hydrolase [Pseudomonas alliivorans]
MATNITPNNTLNLPQEHDADGKLAATTTMSRSSDPVEKSVPCKSGKVVPVIFIPGIMGTNLMNLKTKERVWVAPNMDGVFPKVKTIGLLLGSVFKSPKRRQLELDPRPGVVGVYDGGEIDGGESGLSNNELKTRKWGSIMRTAYHPIMNEMQRQLNSIMVNGKLQGEWEARASQSPSDWGDWEENPSLSELGDASGLKKSADVQYEVWAAGYNWLQSNENSAKDIIDYIDKTIIPTYGGKAKEVLIVTHSMGGLVARAIVACHGYNNLYGVVHGAMPATGAPASYKRIRGGFEAWAEKQILSRDAADAVAVMAFAQGPLELLPSRDYNNAQPWLFVRDKKTGMKGLNLPDTCPYEEIYKSDKWWALIPEANSRLLDPAKIISVNSDDVVLDSPDENPLKNRFHATIDSVKKFHKKIEKKYHSDTYVHYCVEAKANDFLTWGNLEWTAENLEGLDPRSANLTGDNLDSKLRLNDRYTLTVGDTYHPGDGTVPVYSGSAPRGVSGVKGAFAHGMNSGKFNRYCKEGKYNNTVGYKHQDAYTDKDGRTLYATLYSLIRLSQKI